MTMLTLRAYGRTIAVKGVDAAVTMVRELLPPGYREAEGSPERSWEIQQQSEMVWLGLVAGGLLTVGSNIAAATEAVLSNLELWVAEHARRSIFVHAGCVMMNGQAIVLPGRTQSGKSSLTAALARAGAAYYSDEYAVLDHRGLVRPYPRKLGLRGQMGEAVRRVGVEEMGGRSGRGPAEVGLVAVLQYDAVAGWSPEMVTRGQAIIRMFDNTVAARSRPKAALAALEHATSGAKVLAGTRGDADETAQVLLDFLSS